MALRKFLLDAVTNTGEDVAATLNRRNLFQTCRWKCGWGCLTEPANADNPAPTFNDVLQESVSRRGFLQGAAALASVALVAALPRGARAQAPAATAATGRLQGATPLGTGFTPISLATEDRVIVPQGYAQGVVIRWGDPILPGAPKWDFRNQTARAQASQFGYNADYIRFMPFPGEGRPTTRGVLVVNHEYTNPEIMFPGYDENNPTRAHVDIELAAHGASVVEVERQEDGSWRYVPTSRYNRRLTGETEMEITGPAAGHAWMRSTYDPSGRKVRGTLNNCAGGWTPWGTIITSEENFHQYFANAERLPASDRRARVHARYGMPRGASERKWERYHARFDVAQEPNEAFRFGWNVEFDPMDPTFVPKKRTALGRFRHEGGTPAVAPDGRVAIYSGDDERFEYIYKFVTSKPWKRGDQAHNLTLLDEGTLYVARFNADGTGVWLPLVHGQGPLTAANGFESQADVVINVRGAADLLGATRMDRPEDIEWNPVTGVVYHILTNNNRRLPNQVDAANPRPDNRHGHILEHVEDRNDPTATAFRWRVFMLCGDPSNPAHQTYFAGFPMDRVSTISCPDNLTFDRHGNLWIATDGQPSAIRRNDGIFMAHVGGPNRGYTRQFLSAPVGAEVCGPEFTPDQRTLFAAVQHPGEGGTLDKPTSQWPDPGQPPKPAVISVWKTSGPDFTIGS